MHLFKKGNSRKNIMNTIIYTAMFNIKSKRLINLFESIANRCKEEFIFYWITNQDYEIKGWNKIKVDVLNFSNGNNIQRTNRYYKMNPYKFFNSSDINVYFDCWIKDINFKELKKICNEVYNNEKCDLVIAKHPWNKSINQEIIAINKCKKEKLEIMEKQYKNYKDQGFIDDGVELVAGGFQIRKTKSNKLKRFLNLWWDEVKEKSYRDQISFPFLVWKEKFSQYKTISFEEMKNIFYTVQLSKRF